MEENKFVTIKLISFNKQEENSLCAILTLASRALTKKWQVVDNDKADFFLFSVTAVKSDDALKAFPAERCLFCTTGDNEQHKQNLLVDEKHLPCLSILVTLLNRVSTHLNSIKSKPPELTQPIPNLLPETQPCPEQFFDPQKGLLGHLLASQDGQLKISLGSQPDYAPLYIDAEKNAYYSENSLPQLTPYIIADEKLLIKHFPETEIQTIISTENLEPHPLKDLIWYSVIKTSSGKAMKGYSQTDIVKLKSWPNLRLFKCLDYTRLAIFMKNNAAPLEIIAEQTKIPVEVIHSFYNACYLIGLIEKTNKIEINKKVIDAERLDLLTKIDTRLK